MINTTPMKQTLILLFSTIIMVSCSSDDNDSSSRNDHFSITRNGKTYTNNNIAYASLEDYACNDPNLELTATWSASYIENSEFNFSLGIILPSLESTFENGLDYSNSQVNDNGVGIACFNNFDFLPDYSENDKDLSLDGTANNFNKIESITKVSESGEFVVHAIKGNYQLSFSDGNGYNVEVNGNYVLHVEALK